MREGFRVVGPDGKAMPELFREVRRDRSQVEVEDIKSGARAVVHCTRIISSKKEEQMATQKVSGTPKFDFKSIAGERWSKPMAFDHKGVKAEAHVIVNRITKKYRAFNTYNASLGKQGKTGSVFAFKDYAQLIARLMDRGYNRRQPDGESQAHQEGQARREGQPLSRASCAREGLREAREAREAREDHRERGDARRHATLGLARPQGEACRAGRGSREGGLECERSRSRGSHSPARPVLAPRTSITRSAGGKG